MFLQPGHFPDKQYNRIISLVPSITELLFYLQLENEVVGITKFCVLPENWFRNKTRVGGTKNINYSIVDQLCPDLIIANKEENVKDQIEKLAGKYDVFVTDVNTLSDAITMINEVGKLTGKTMKASSLANEITDGFETLQQISSSKRKIRTAYFIWKDPFMVAGSDTFINDMMTYCGFENIFARQKRYPEITLNEVVENDCELIVLSSEPYPFKYKHKDELQKKFPQIKIMLADGEMFSWYGSRLLESVHYFNKILDRN
jgi:ABC-type Fe3+-hydroxamate transport system substrate-binding protein